MSEFTLKDLKTNEIYYLDPARYSSEWIKPEEIDEEMAAGDIMVFQKPKQDVKFTLVEEDVLSERYVELFTIWQKREDRLFEFTDWRGNKCNVRVFNLREPESSHKGIHSVSMTFIVKERL